MRTVKNSLILAGGCLFALLVITNAARADYISSDSLLPSPSYSSTDQVAFQTPGGTYQIDSFFDIFTELDRVQPPPVGGAQVDSFFDIFTEISLEVPGSTTAIRESPTRQSIGFTDNSSSLPPDQRAIDTEMLQLDLSGGTMPPGVMIRESPTKQSLGRTSITDIGGGQFQIHSFFDVFTELSIDGGQTWTPASGPLHLTGVPEPSSVALAALGLLGLGVVARRKKHRRF